MEAQLSLNEAAKMAGTSVSTIRRWAQQKMVTAGKDARGNWKVGKDSLHTFLATGGGFMEPTRRIRGASSHSEAESPDSSTETILNLLQEGLERERRVNDELRSMLDERERTIRTLEAEMRAILQKQTDSDGVLSRWLRR
jgi:hypothetical protein